MVSLGLPLLVCPHFVAPQLASMRTMVLSADCACFDLEVPFLWGPLGVRMMYLLLHALLFLHKCPIVRASLLSVGLNVFVPVYSSSALVGVGQLTRYRLTRRPKPCLLLVCSLSEQSSRAVVLVCEYM
jgi:hypothetical protein